MLGSVVAVTFPRSLAYRTGRLRVDASGLHLDDELVAARSELAGGLIAESERDTHAWLFGDGGRFALRFRTPSIKQSNQLLAALELAPEQRAPLILLKAGPLTRWAWLLPTVLGVGVVPVAFLLLVLPDGMQVPIAATIVALVVLSPFAFQLLGAKRVQLGVDGVTVHQVWRERFVAYRDIERVEYWKAFRVRRQQFLPRGFTLHLRDGATIRMRTAEARQVTGQGEEADDDYIATTIRQRMDRPAGQPLPGLEQGDRSMADWLAALRALRSRDGGYRSTQVTDDELWSALEDGTLEPRCRIAAAIALATGASADDQKRMSHAAAASASRLFRDAIEATQAGDEAELTRLIARL